MISRSQLGLVSIMLMMLSGCSSVDVSTDEPFASLVGKEVLLQQPMMIWDQSSVIRCGVPRYQMTQKTVRNLSYPLVASLSSGTPVRFHSFKKRRYPFSGNKIVYAHCLVQIPGNDDAVVADIAMYNSLFHWEDGEPVEQPGDDWGHESGFQREPLEESLGAGLNANNLSHIMSNTKLLP